MDAVNNEVNQSTSVTTPPKNPVSLHENYFQTVYFIQGNRINGATNKEVEGPVLTRFIETTGNVDNEHTAIDNYLVPTVGKAVLRLVPKTPEEKGKN